MAETPKPNAIDTLLQQEHTSYSFSNNFTYSRPSIQIYEPTGAILIQPNIGNNERFQKKEQINTFASWE